MKIECDDCKECIEQGVDYCLHLLTTHGVMKMNKKEMEIRLFNLKQMRNQYMSFRCYPRPKTSPYDKEIKTLEMKLEEM